MGAAEAVQRVLMQRHVKEIIADIHDAETEAAGALLDVGDKKVASLDGTPLGKVELRPAVASVRIVDRPALLDWIRETHPDWIQKGPDVDPLQAALLRARAWPAAGDPDVALLIDAATQHLLALQKQPTGGLREGIERGLLDNLKANGGQRIDPETGEIEDVPGIEYDPGAPKAFVSVDRKSGAREKIAALLTSGGLPALTTGPES